MTIPTTALRQVRATDLSDVQRAAVAKLLYVTERPGALAVLCGPTGTGTTSVLDAVARACEAAGRTSRVISALDEGESQPERPLDVLLIDDADRIGDGRLAARVAHWWGPRKEASLVLAGTGRLLTLISREPRLERLVQLRAILAPFSRAETRQLVASITGASLPTDQAAADSVSDTIHEVTGGIPAAVTRLAELAGVVGGIHPDRPLSPDDIELVHRRLAVTAA
ncbi:MAG: hypothetical protein ACKOEX_06885 [Planctomycetia bacterium]